MVWACATFKKDEGDWLSRCLTYEVEGTGLRDRPESKKTWKEVVGSELVFALACI